MGEEGAERLLARLGLQTRLFAGTEEAVYAVFNDRDRAKLLAIAREGGELRWRREDPEGWAIVPPVVAGRLVLLGTSRAAMRPSKEGEPNWLREGSLYALDAHSGETRWEDRRVGVVRESPHLREGGLQA
ncbi:MAG: PQQ-binding-like beta-propeller repeat protein, partial [Nitrospinota bacterium]